MPVPRKDIIKALVQKYTNMSPTPGLSTSWRADFIENKGEGHIFLLHGGPGVGKTYTAECIAEYTYCPLLSLTCGDIGTDDVKMEQQLSKWFRLAEKWGAVMLIDEADIYLERRVVSDLRRNSLVFVFLRSFQTAVALAEFRFLQKTDKKEHDGPTLDQKDFEQVCQMRRQFKEYLHDLHGLDEEGRAYNARARAGNHDLGRDMSN
ncbi:uncharacterized protein QC763_510590 [Podospora pseudopauciseta]|uniref:AAA+ ATPase domain-containing protein n=1 Tax=Podospora pseudopauciseta TaxID=2093780 RepID=A0ABR0HBA7_9PEZI|nr:hypothetical protein QC763_510590 [Podospora pseudopauciseta]